MCCYRLKIRQWQCKYCKCVRGYRKRCTANGKEAALLIRRLFNPRETSMVSVSLSRLETKLKTKKGKKIQKKQFENEEYQKHVKEKKEMSRQQEKMRKKNVHVFLLCSQCLLCNVMTSVSYTADGDGFPHFHTVPNKAGYSYIWVTRWRSWLRH